MAERQVTKMKYAVIYQSKSGNTRKIAEEIYEALSTNEKEIYDIDSDKNMPEADIYFIGFGIHNNSCSMDIINCFDEISGSRFAIFATCGYVPTQQYKGKLERQLDVWMPEDADYLGMFLCQGNVERDRRTIMIGQMPSQEDKLRQMFEVGSSHPDEDDLSKAGEFAKGIQVKAEYNGEIPIW